LHSFIEKGRFVVSVFKSTAIGLDEFDGVDDHFEAAAVLAFIGFPFGLLQISDNSDTGTGMEILFSDFGILVEATHLIQPVFSRPDLNARENDVTGSPSDPKKISGSFPRLPVNMSWRSLWILFRELQNFL
jgi:hypothetical protein